jgi:putative nucleotidyltransferase with HDIG domain
MSPKKTRILVIDDDPQILDVCREGLDAGGYSVTTAATGSAAQAALSTTAFPLVLCDVLLPDTNGLELLDYMKSRFPDTFVIITTGHASVDLAKEAIRQGAFDFVSKPFSMGDLLDTVRRAEISQRSLFSDIAYKELKTLYELTTETWLSDVSVSSFLGIYSAKIQESFSADAVRIYLTESPRSNRLKLMAQTGMSSISDEVSWYFLAGRTMQAGGEVLIDPGTENPDLAGSNAAFMGIVIPAGDIHLGVVLAARQSHRDKFKTRDLKMLELYSAQMGNQLHNLRMTQDLLRKNRELEQINVLTHEFSADLDPERVARLAAAGIRCFAPFDVMAVFIPWNDVSLFSYISADASLDHDRVIRAVRKELSALIHSDDIERYMYRAVYDTFTAGRAKEFDRLPEFQALSLPDYGSVQGNLLLGTFSGEHRLTSQSRFTPILIRNALAALNNALLHQDSKRNYLQTIVAMAQAVDAKDPYTHDHSRNVTAYTLAIADGMGISGRERELLWSAALLHDIGKIGVPESILNKPGRLSDEEFRIIKSHPEKGCQILKPVTAFQGILGIVRHHHERFDGKGYPDGLKEKAIPLQARILTVADAYDAMSSDRVYRKSPGPDYAIDQLVQCSGTQFDPEIAELFLRILRNRSPEAILDNYNKAMGEGIPVPLA